MDPRDVFVKVVRPGENVAAEAETLRAFGSDRAARVIDVRQERGELVLERVEPGATLATTADEDTALGVIADLFSRGWPTPSETTALAPFEQYAGALLNGSAESARASGVLSELLDDSAERTVLHGDLHYGNILSSCRAGYVLIDPKGVVGEPAFDIGYLVSRYAPSAVNAVPLLRAIERRLAFLPDALGLDARRVAAYAYVAAVLSMMWAVEDGEAHATRAFAEVARLLEHRL